MDSTKTRSQHPHHNRSTPPSSSSSLTSSHKARAALHHSTNNKALSRSVIADSLDYFLPKPYSNPTLLRTLSDSRGEIVKLVYESSAKKKTAIVKPEKVNDDVEKEEEDVKEVKRRMPKLEIVEVKKGLRKEDEKREVRRVAAGLGRRRSFCGSETSLSSFLGSNGARIVAVDMPPFMQIHAVDCARKAYDSLEKFTSKSLALSLKKVAK